MTGDLTVHHRRATPNQADDTYLGQTRIPLDMIVARSWTPSIRRHTTSKESAPNECCKTTTCQPVAAHADNYTTNANTTYQPRAATRRCQTNRPMTARRQRNSIANEEDLPELISANKSKYIQNSQSEAKQSHTRLTTLKQRGDHHDY